MVNLEMSLTDIEKKLADNYKKFFSNNSKIQTCIKNCNVQILKLTEENKKLENESKVLHLQKFQKLFEETKARMLEQAKMLSVENLFLPVKDKSKKNPIGEKSKKVAEAKISDNSHSAVEENSKRAFERYFGLTENSF